MLLEQTHIGDGHASVDRFAHVVNRQQGDLNGGERFHLDAGLSYRFNRRGALDAVAVFRHLKLHGNTGQGQGVTQGDQVTGFFGGLNACNPGNAQHIALLGMTAANQVKCSRQHADATTGNANPTCVGFVGHIDHVGLALGIKVSECGHGQIHRGLT